MEKAGAELGELAQRVVRGDGGSVRAGIGHRDVGVDDPGHAPVKTDAFRSQAPGIAAAVLALMVLRTLLTMRPQHGYGIARRIEQTSGGRLIINYGTLYPSLLKLEQEGLIRSAWGTSDNNRKARFYTLTRAGHRQIERDTRQWEETADIMARFLRGEQA